MKRLTIVIPTYNEEEKIRQVIMAIPCTIAGIDQVSVVVVDDGSRDGTLKALDGLDVIVIKHGKNLGLGRTFQDGLKQALELGSDYMVNVDGDGQFDPLDIPKLLAPLFEDRADFVSASRFLDRTLIPNMPTMKHYGNIVVAKIISFILGVRFYDVSCGFRAYNAEALLRLNLIGKFTYTQETFIDLGNKGIRIIEVAVPVQYFKERRSRIAANLFRYTWRIMKIIFRTVRDYKPMKFFGVLGALFFVAGLFLEAGLLAYYLKSGSFTPYKVIGFSGAFFNILGVVIFFLGLIADMLYRMRMNQEELLYLLKKQEWEKKNDISGS